MKRGRNEFGHDFTEKGSGHEKKRKSSKRPSIPAEVRKQVLFESGHRCAVCGEPLPLELAHIIPYCKSNDNTFENLICLCANCHERADHEHWGERILRKYKSLPCVHRKYKDREAAQLKMTKVEIRIDFEYEHWKPNSGIIFQHALADFLKIPPKLVKIKSVRKGSVRIDVMLPEVEAERLIRAYEKEDQTLSVHLAPFSLLGIEIYRAVESCKRLQKMDVFSYDFIEKLCTPCYEMITATCPGSTKARNKVFDDAWQAFLNSANPPKHNSMLNSIKQFAADMLVSYKLRIEEYNDELIQQHCKDITPVLEKWPTLSETYLARLSLWLMNDINLRIGLAVEHSLDLDREIIDHVIGWKNDREGILNEAKSVFISNYKFLGEYMKDNVMPHYLLSALLDESLGVSSCDELALIKTDLIYCHALVKSNMQ